MSKLPGFEPGISSAKMRREFEQLTGTLQHQTSKLPLGKKGIFTSISEKQHESKLVRPKRKLKHWHLGFFSKWEQSLFFGVLDS